MGKHEDPDLFASIGPLSNKPESLVTECVPLSKIAHLIMSPLSIFIVSGENPVPFEPPAAPIGTLIGYVTPKTSGIDMKQTSEIKKTEINRSFIE